MSWQTAVRNFRGFGRTTPNKSSTLALIDKKTPENATPARNHDHSRSRVVLDLRDLHQIRECGLLSTGHDSRNARSNLSPSRTQELQSELLAWENLMICRRTESNDILLELVAKTLAVGATEMEVEYEDREEHVLAFQEGVGFGIARLDASSEEAQALREALYQIKRKQKIVTIEGVEYRLRARIHQSFGEDVFRVTIKKG